MMAVTDRIRSNHIFSFVILLSIFFQGWTASAAKPFNPLKRSRCGKNQFEGISSKRAVVDAVVDGDTIHVKIKKKYYSVRLLSVDTPETFYNGNSQGYWGERASKYLKRLLRPGDRVKLEFDHESCDSFGRILAHVWKRMCMSIVVCWHQEWL